MRTIDNKKISGICIDGCQIAQRALVNDNSQYIIEFDSFSDFDKFIKTLKSNKKDIERRINKLNNND